MMDDVEKKTEERKEGGARDLGATLASKRESL